ncbi:MAG: helix-turn-helix domain-containing protein [Mediterranea sp.]|jgi:predicted DNA-binding transcriptional regulator AlpA|nr:helix-turn-helix domain-containing protein [Mediterranea sp.]
MTDRELTAFMQGWFERFIIRFDRLDKHLEKMAMKEKLLEGERLLDNQDVCQLLNISKRTLQRYRSSGELPYQMIYHKTFYKESDVEAFIKANFAKGENPDDSTEEDTDNDTPKDTGNEPEETDRD